MASRTTTALLLLSPLLLAVGEAATFNIVNRCGFPVWPVAIPAGGGRRLDPGQAWALDVPAGTSSARIWARTGCSGGGTGCQTGDCGALACTKAGQPPATLAEFTLNGGTSRNQDSIDISLIDGFNVPMNFLPDSGCAGAHCPADINAQCPAHLKVPGGCRNDDNDRQFFRNLCPEAYSAPNDRKTLTCPSGTHYSVTFCP